MRFEEYKRDDGKRRLIRLFRRPDKLEICVVQKDGTPRGNCTIAAITDDGVLEIYKGVDKTFGLRLDNDGKIIVVSD